MSSSVDRIKEKLGIEEVVGSYIKLEKAGTYLKAKCPFHNEKSASFFVSPSRGTYYCFGCGAKGDMFTFVQEFESLDFMGSLKVLAERAGVTLERENKEMKSERDRLLSAMEISALFFQRKLAENESAKDYLAGRGLSPASVSGWRIGYAPDEWRTLHAHLKEKGFTDAEMEKAGLIKRTETGFYDRFRGRVMFPISDSSGRVIAFTGRIFPAKESEQAPKYLNSPETPLFSKSSVLYGFHRAKQGIRALGFSIVVEGQMDLIMSHQAGYTNTVAPSGTALTQEQLGLVRKISEKVVMAFDSDSAGVAAALKSAEMALSLGMDVKIASIEGGKDPADLVKADPKIWKETVKNSKHVVEFALAGVLKKTDDGRKVGQEVRAKVLPYIAMIESAIDRSHFIKLISKETAISEQALWDDLKKVRSAGAVAPADLPVSAKSLKRKDHIIRKLLGIIWWRGDEGSRIAEKCEKAVGKEGWSRMASGLDKDREEIIFETEAYYSGKDDWEKEVEDLVRSLEEETLKQEFAERMAELGRAEKGKDGSDAAILKRCQEITARLSELRSPAGA